MATTNGSPFKNDLLGAVSLFHDHSSQPDLQPAWLRFSGLRQEYIIVVSNRNPNHALARYARCWHIECLFKALKAAALTLGQLASNT